jgi:hypothetical protein
MATRSQETLERLEHEARQARATVSSQLAQVRHRLEPQVIKDQAEGYKNQLMDQARERSSQYVEDRKRKLKQTVVDAAMNNPAPTFALGTIVAWSLWRRLSQIPAPILLVGAGGLAGLMRWNDGSSRPEDRQTHTADYGYARPEEQRTYGADYGRARPEEQRRPGAEQSGGTLSSIGESAKDAAERAREMASEAGPRIGEAAARAGAAVSDMASDAATRISQGTQRAASAVSDAAGRSAGGISRGAGGAGTTASDLGRQARSQFSELFERHPLVLGGLGLALGAAIAYSFRPTETEARWVGETSDRFKRRAREMAEEQFHRARTVAERAYEAAGDEAREQGISPEGGREAAAEVGRKARAVADRAKEAAREEWNAETTA